MFNPGNLISKLTSGPNPRLSDSNFSANASATRVNAPALKKGSVAMHTSANSGAKLYSSLGKIMIATSPARRGMISFSNESPISSLKPVRNVSKPSAKPSSSRKRSIASSTSRSPSGMVKQPTTSPGTEFIISGSRPASPRTRGSSPAMNEARMPPSLKAALKLRN